MNILMMGATGYLGSHIVSVLEKGNVVFGICHKTSCESKRNMICIPQSDYKAFLSRHNIDWVINCIGAYQKESIADMIEANFSFPSQVIGTALSYGVENILNINTALPEELNVYSFTKRMLGHFGKCCCTWQEVNFYNLLVEMFYGEDEPEDRFLSTLIGKMKVNQDVLLTDGNQRRDIVHIEDVCQAVSLTINSQLKGYYDIPVGTGEGHTIREIAQYLHSKLNSSSSLLFGAVPMRKNEPDSIANISLLEKLGYKVRYPWTNGLNHMCQQIK